MRSDHKRGLCVSWLGSESNEEISLTTKFSHAALDANEQSFSVTSGIARQETINWVFGIDKWEGKLINMQLYEFCLLFRHGAKSQMVRNVSVECSVFTVIAVLIRL